MADLRPTPVFANRRRSGFGAVGGGPSWARWNDRFWPRRAGWSPQMTALVGRTTTAPQRWPYPRTVRASPVPVVPRGWTAPNRFARGVG